MKLSVAIITYNQGRYIKDCLEGILNQKTNFDFEIIIGDDCSSDDTLTICQEYSHQHPRIKILENKTNLGYSENWKRTLNSCSGEYIAPIEGDDYWINESKLQKQVDFLDRNPSVGLCYTDCNIFYEDTKKTDKRIVKNGITYIHETNPFMGNHSYKCNVSWVIRNKVIDFNKLEDNCLDIPLNIYYEIYYNKYQVGYVDILSAVYRRHINSISYNPNNYNKIYQHKKSIFFLCEKYLKLFHCYDNYYYLSNISLIKEGYKQNDKEIITKFENYLNNIDSSAMIEIFSKMNSRIAYLQNLIDAIKTTKSYKLGKFLTAPLRWIKKHLHK